MESMFDRVEKTAGTRLTKMRWALGLNGLLSIAFGVVILVRPGISLYAIALGIIAVGGAFWLPLDGGDTALMILSGMVSILFGIVIFARPAPAHS
jgi:uncharacterized membrane protein HdeD (DUF308 family)